MKHVHSIIMYVARLGVVVSHDIIMKVKVRGGCCIKTCGVFLIGTSTDDGGKSHNFVCIFPLMDK